MGVGRADKAITIEAIAVQAITVQATALQAISTHVEDCVGVGRADEIENVADEQQVDA